MYDTWFTMGLALMRPALLDAITAADPVFDFVDRTITETGSDGVTVTLPKAPSTGLLENIPTTRVRLAITTFAKSFNSAAPPIGIYCAGRFSQYAKIPAFTTTLPDSSKFSDIVAIANTGYVNAVAGGTESTRPELVAFLGLCMLDGALADNLASPTQQQKDIATEFGIEPVATNREWAIATAFVQTDEFVNAANLLMAGDMDPWEAISGEQIIFWQNFNEHAIP